MADDGKGVTSNNINNSMGQICEYIHSRLNQPCENPPKDSEISFWGFLGQLSGIMVYSLFVVQAAYFSYSAWLQYIQFRCKETEEAEVSQLAAAPTELLPTRQVTVKEKRVPKGVSIGAEENSGRSAR